MKKTRAIKVLCAVLTAIMVLGTGLSAMAFNVTTNVSYDLETSSYSVETTVNGLENEEMVTYLVHNANSMYEVTATDIDYIDQKNVNDAEAIKFEYNGTGDWTAKNNKIFIGADNLAAPVQSAVEATPVSATVKVNGNVVNNAGVEAFNAGIATVAIADAAKATEVKVNGVAVEFFIINGKVAFAYETALSKADTIEIAAAENNVLTGETSVRIGTVKVTENTLVAFGRVFGAYDECGIQISDDEGLNEKYPALGVSQSAGTVGGFAIELIAEDGNLLEEFNGCYVDAYVKIGEGEDAVVTTSYDFDLNNSVTIQ